MASKLAVVILALLLVVVGILPLGTLHVNSQISPDLPSYVELGYSPGSLESIQEGIPVYSPGDSLWAYFTSGIVSSVSLYTPAGASTGTHDITSPQALEIYTFSTSDTEGSWSLRITFQNSSTYSLAISFVNPESHVIDTSLRNYSISSGNLSLGFSMNPSSNASDFQDCLVSPDVNSTIPVHIPSDVGDGNILVTPSLQSATLSLSGEAFQQFNFWYQMEYSYSFTGNVSGELVSRDITAITSSTAVFGTTPTPSVLLTNNTNPRPGRYLLEGYFDSGSQLFVERTSALLSDSGRWLWIGGCGPDEVSSLSFTQNATLSRGPNSWPTNVYLMYNYAGVDSYSSLPLGLDPARIDLVGTGNVSLPYLTLNLAPNPQVLASGDYDGSLYLIGKNFPLSVSVTPVFGNESLGEETVSLIAPFDVKPVTIPVGSLDVLVTNNSAPVTGASITIQNDFGGSAGFETNSAGRATIYLPVGSYTVSAASGSSSMSENANISLQSQSSLQFSFTTTVSIAYLEDLLLSFLVVGIALNVWLWVVRPRRSYY